MLFSEPTFLFFFLPAVLLLYFGPGRRSRDLVLLGSSLVFYAWGEHGYVLILIASIVLNWSCGLAAGRGCAA
jgi:alginate O-acetyltransferase complex protein AlgI